MPPGNPSGYGPNGIVWRSDPYQPPVSPLEKAINVGLVAGAGGALFLGAKYTPVGSGTGLDFVQRLVRHGSNVIPPSSLLNTFRAAEHLSPFVSGAAYVNRSKYMKNMGGGTFSYTWDSSVLKTTDTADWLRTVVGAEHPALVSGVINTEELGDLVFESRKGSSAGRLFFRKGTQETLLSNAISLVEASPIERGSEAAPKKASTYIQSIAQSMVTPTGETLTERKGFDVNRVFVEEVRDEAGDVIKRNRAMLMPVASITGPVNSVDDFWRRTTLLRAPFAFGMERLNRLIQVAGEQIPFVGAMDEALRKNLNMSLGVKSGPASKMFARFGIKGAGILGAGLLIQQTDWLRRQGGFGGEVIASGAVSIASTAVMSKLGHTKLGLAAGIVGFFGQLGLPNFDKGLWTGMVSTAAGLDVATTAAGELTLANTYRRTVEGFLPGISSPEFGALAGLTVVGLAHSRFPRYLLENYDVNQYLPKYMQFDAAAVPDPRAALDQLPKSTREYYMDLALEKARTDFGIVPEKDTMLGRRKAYNEMLKRSRTMSADEMAKFQDELSGFWEAGEQARKTAIAKNPLDASLAAKYRDIGYGGSPVERVTRFAKRVGATLSHSFFGAGLEGDALKEFQSAYAVKSRLGRLGILFGAGFLAQGLLTGGLLGSMEGAGEKYDQYFGSGMVAVRRAQFWEAGGAPFRGEDIMYYRPSYLNLLKSRSRQVAEWGEDEDTISPIGKFFRKNFTYELERRQYYDRPYPISGTAFEDIPVIGRALAATIGQLIKPAKLMHVPEWARVGRDGRTEFAVAPEPGGPAYNLGGLGPGTPVSPYSSARTIGYLNYQFRELEGMTGWLKNVIQKSITGSEFSFVGRPELASASLMGSLREQFWELNLGGGLFTTEAIRRFLPSERGERQEYNPILNNMPSWMPSRFHYGDPYRKVELGYARMPGSGYEALHPELQGYSPENYPLIYRYEILADVAPTSKEFLQTRERLYSMRASGQSTPEIDAYMDRIDAQVASKRTQQFGGVDDRAIQLPGAGFTQRAFAGAQTAVRKIAAPAEYMIPMGFRPFQKLMADRGAIEQYEYERLYGSKVAFWDEPIRDWFRPAFYSAANLLGWDGKPGWRKDADAINGYFDRLEFVKQMTLAQQAQAMGDSRAASDFRYQASKTRFGVNPQGDPMGIYMSLPDSEKKFFDAFSFADPRDRARILEMIPEDQVHLYKTIWDRIDNEEFPYPGSGSSVSDMYLNSRMADIQQYTYNEPMPGTDWVGWHEDVDMSDVKLRYIENLGKDIHEYDMWHKQVRMLARKPYLEGSEKPFGSGIVGRQSIQGHLYDMAREPNGRQPLELSAFQNGTSLGSTADFYYNDDRSGSINRMYRKYSEY